MKDAIVKSKFKLVTMLILAIVALIVVVQNMQMVSARLLFVTISMPQAIMLMLLVGFTGGVFAALKFNTLRSYQSAASARSVVPDERGEA